MSAPIRSIFGRAAAIGSVMLAVIGGIAIIACGQSVSPTSGVSCKPAGAAVGGGPMGPDSAIGWQRCELGWSNCSDGRRYSVSCESKPGERQVCSCTVDGHVERGFTGDVDASSTTCLFPLIKAVNDHCGWALSEPAP